MLFTIDTIFLCIVSILLDLLGQLGTLNPHVSATKHDRDMQISGMESVLDSTYIPMENSQYQNQHQKHKLSHCPYCRCP